MQRWKTYKINPYRTYARQVERGARYYMNQMRRNPIRLANYATRLAGYYTPSSKRAYPKSLRRRKKKMRSRTNPRTISKRVDKLSRVVESGMGTHISRVRTVDRVLGSVNSKTHSNFDIVTASKIETVLSELRYYNPSAPTTLVNASGTSGTYHKEFFFDTVYSKFIMRNNYQVPAKVTIYIVQAKGETNIAPVTAFTNGLTDVGNPSSTSPLVYLTDSDQFTDLYKIAMSKSYIIEPGQEVQCTYSGKKFQYDPSLYDSHALAYQKRFEAHSAVVAVTGVVGHDSTLDEQGVLQSGVDILFDVTYKLKYNAGIDLKYISVTDGSDTFTNGGLVSSKPVSDNIAYSLG